MVWICLEAFIRKGRVRMELIKMIFEKYYPEYDIKDKILFLTGNIPVREFKVLKYYIERIKEEVRDIRVN